MKSNNIAKILPVIISIFIFLVLVFGAGYAFYSAAINAQNITNIEASLPKMTSLDTTATDCGMNITPMMMTPENANMNYTHTCTVNVTINGSRSAFCTYDLYVEELSTVSYSPSQGVGSGDNQYEFTGSITGSATTGEVQMETVANNNILTGETITVVEDDTPVTKSYIITEKWYNLNLAQDSHANKSYYYKFRVANVVC